MMLIATYLAPSPIHGLDLELKEELLKHSNPNIAAFLKRYTYPHPTHAGILILDGDNGRFMNHSERPNTDFTSTGSSPPASRSTELTAVASMPTRVGRAPGPARAWAPRI